MKSIKIFSIVVLLLAAFTLGVCAENTAMMRTAYDFATNPRQFLFEVENDATMYFIPTNEKRFDIQTNLVLNTLTIFNPRKVTSRISSRYLLPWQRVHILVTKVLPPNQNLS